MRWLLWKLGCIEMAYLIDIGDGELLSRRFHGFSQQAKVEERLAENSSPFKDAVGYVKLRGTHRLCFRDGKIGQTSGWRWRYW